MPIHHRLNSPRTSDRSSQSTSFGTIKADLLKALKASGGKSSKLSAKELAQLIQRAKAEGSSVEQELQATLKEGIQSGMIDGRPLQMNPGTLKKALTYTGLSAHTMTDDKGENLLVMRKADKASVDERWAIGRNAAKRLLGIAEKYKDVEGSGQESGAKGDPRITARRSAIATLIANNKKKLVSLPQLETLSDNVKNDIKWLLAAERTDYRTDDDDTQFSWAKSRMSNSRSIHKEFQRRILKGKKQAGKFAAKTDLAFDASDGSVAGISYLKKPSVKAAALVDTLLQFRARTDLANQKEKTWGDESTRMDMIGPSLIAEQRILLSTADLDSQDPLKLREYALLRQVISSHPTSSVNGIFEARNAVGALFMDGALNYGDKKHDMAWVKEEIPPGASTSAYKAIHHNFSRDTPGNVEAMIAQWVFPKGPSSLGDSPSGMRERATVFSSLVRTMYRAQAGDVTGARDAVLDMDGAHFELVKPLLDRLDLVADDKVSGTIQAYLSESAIKPLVGTSLELRLKKLAEHAKKTSSFGYSNALISLQKLEGPRRAALQPLLDQLEGMAQTDVAATVETFLDNLDESLPSNLGQNLDYFARLYRSVCETQPSARSLEKNLFRAGPAWVEVADVIAQLQTENDLATLRELGEARLAMREAIISAETGYERHERIQFDADLSRLTCTELGAAVERVESLKTDAQKAEALLAVQTALRSAMASGLHEIKDPNDPASTKGRALDEVLGDVDSALGDGKIGEQAYRAMMADVYVAVARTVQNIRAYVDARAAAVSKMGAELDPEFMDQLVKESPLHYATALAEKGMRAGLKEEIGPRCIANIEGMRVLNSVGPVVFSSVVCAENTKDLIKLQPSSDAMSIIYGLEEKKMVAVGGLIVDTKDAPGGNSHLNMYAMNNGISVLALPELRTRYSEFIENAQAEGGIYADDRNGEFKMMTVEYAKEQGLITDADLPRLRPGTNKKISYLRSKGVDDGFEVVERHTAMVSPDRLTREVELYIPMAEVSGLGKSCASFEEIATLGIHGRHLCGEKGLVLAILRNDPELAAYVPDGSVVTTGRCRLLLLEAGIEADWNKVWLEDPKVGVIDEDNFLKSAFYSDADFRATTRQYLQDLTREKLQAHLIRVDQAGEKSLTPAGEKLYAELVANQTLADSDNWITRSSFTGEDRPGKSGAGQYESFPHLKDPVSRIEGVIGVIESSWMAEPVENNVADEINLKHIMPSVVVQDCLEPQYSGVMISRDIEHGTRGQVYYQLVKGFGGGVEGGKTEEGTITASGHRVKINYPGEEDGLVPAESLKDLRDIVLRVETLFNEIIEKAAGYAVDMEVARVDGQWSVVQARVIQLDR